MRDQPPREEEEVERIDDIDELLDWPAQTTALADKDARVAWIAAATGDLA